MIRKLDVFLYNKKVGVLRDLDGKLSFKYDLEAIKPLSVYLPIQEKAYSDKICRPFFENLLPEGNIRKFVAIKEKVSEENSFSLLDKIGGDCAGAVSLYPKNQKTTTNQKEEKKQITEEELHKIIKNQKTFPLLTNEDVRLSLAGAQSKFAVYIKNEKMFYPNDSFFSSHLIKPENENLNDIVINEYFCMKLAKESNINVPNVKIQKAKNKIYLLIDRYDRVETKNNQKRERLHQEDFCQILGHTSARKYQKEGGASFKNCFQFIKNNIGISSAESFLRILIFNYLIGNCDAHAKNFSILHKKKLCLAPFYDLVSTEAYADLYPNSKSWREIAMKIGTAWDIREIQKIDFYKLAKENNIKEKEIDNLVNEFLKIVEKAEKIKQNLEQNKLKTKICDKIIKGIKIRLKKLV